ncbi:hypothetical protein [Mycobacterium marinum]|uniref:hypothetical protein n=1 Tax=Mycobacterium marinum TaxID=1781 RepID=UPI003563C708
MKAVEVDFTRGLHSGLVRASQRRASELMRVGDRVLAVDPEEGMEFTGTVERVDENGFAYLRMEWAAAHPQREFVVRFQPEEDQDFGFFHPDQQPSEGEWIFPVRTPSNVVAGTSFTIDESSRGLLLCELDEEELNPATAILAS